MGYLFIGGWFEGNVASERVYQEGDVGVPAGQAEFDPVAVGEILDRSGERAGCGHGGALDKHWDYGDLAGEGGGDFETDEVVGIIEAAGSCGVGDGEPLAANDGEEDAALGYALVDGKAEVLAGLDAGDVHEDSVAAECANEVVVEATGFSAGVVAAVADEDGIGCGFRLQERGRVRIVVGAGFGNEEVYVGRLEGW